MTDIVEKYGCVRRRSQGGRTDKVQVESQQVSFEGNRTNSKGLHLTDLISMRCSEGFLLQVPVEHRLSLLMSEN